MYFDQFLELYFLYVGNVLACSTVIEGYMLVEVESFIVFPLVSVVV